MSDKLLSSLEDMNMLSLWKVEDHSDLAANTGWQQACSGRVVVQGRWSFTYLPNQCRLTFHKCLILFGLCNWDACYVKMYFHMGILNMHIFHRVDNGKGRSKDGAPKQWIKNSFSSLPCHLQCFWSLCSLTFMLHFYKPKISNLSALVMNGIYCDCVIVLAVSTFFNSSMQIHSKWGSHPNMCAQPYIWNEYAQQSLTFLLDLIPQICCSPGLCNDWFNTLAHMCPTLLVHGFF